MPGLPNLPIDDTPDEPEIPNIPEDPEENSPQNRVESGDRLGEFFPDVAVGESDLGAEKGVIIMRNSDDLLYTLVALTSTQGTIGPFIDRNGVNRVIS